MVFYEIYENMKLKRKEKEKVEKLFYGFYYVIINGTEIFNICFIINWEIFFLNMDYFQN